MEQWKKATSERGATGAAERGIVAPAFRLPAGLRLGRVRLQVADLERSLAYYTDVLGLVVLRRTETDALLGVPAGDADRADDAAAATTPAGPTPLVELHERRGAAPVPQHGRQGLYHFAILLPDRPALGRFLAHLSEIGARAGMSDHLVSEAIYLRDPDGLGIEVYADRPRESWRYDGPQLVMDTRPLDVQAVLAAGGGAPWTGLPAGTRMGHVHLHVGELQRAAEFYHAALGFDAVVWSYPGALFLSAGGYHHHLGLNTWAAGSPSPGDDEAQLLDWELILPRSDADAAADSLAAAGFPVSAEGDGWAARDPWGTVVRIAPE